MITPDVVNLHRRGKREDAMSTVPEIQKQTARIDWVDVAKGLGIFLVFYGHFVQQFISLGVPGSVEQMRWIYSFHMPFFFFLVGVVYKDRDLPFEQFLKRQVLTRLVPAWVFNVVAMFLWIATEHAAGAAGWMHQYGWDAVPRYCGVKLFSVFVLGRPEFNVLTWFLICLFSAELIHFALHRYLRSTIALIASIVCLAGLAIVMDLFNETIINVLGERRHWWLATSSVTALAFFQIGILMRRFGWLSITLALPVKCVLATAFLAGTVLTYNLNQAVTGYKLPVALMVEAHYGDLAWFALTALLGIGFMIFLSQIFATSQIFKYIGQITLALMCLNGLLLEFANLPLAEYIARNWPNQHLLVFTGTCTLCVVLSLLACLPVNWLITNYAPFMLGRVSGKPRSNPIPAAKPEGTARE